LPRHRTLRALIDWGHELLSEPEKAVLRRVSVFAGGWTLEAAERVCSDASIEPRAVLALLTSLVDKSLVRADSGSEELRFGILETVRHYAQDRLHDSGEGDEVHERLVACLQDLSTGLDIKGNDDALRLTLLRLDRERDNLRAALSWCERSRHHALAGLRLAGDLAYFWQLRGLRAEGLAWLARLLAVVPATPEDAVHAMAHSAIGYLLCKEGDYAAALTPMRKGIHLWQQLGDRKQLRWALGQLGDIEFFRGEHAAARLCFERSLAIARELGSAAGIAAMLYSLSALAYEASDFAAAQTLLDEALPLARKAGAGTTASVLSELGSLRRVQGDTAGARAALQEAVEMRRVLGDRGGLAWDLLTLSEVCHELGDITAAKAYAVEAWHASAGLQRERVRWLDSFAGLLMDPYFGTHVAAAVRLWGSVQAAVTAVGTHVVSTERQQHLLSVARAAVGDEEAFNAAWREGGSWSIDETLVHAQTLLDAVNNADQVP